MMPGRYVGLRRAVLLTLFLSLPAAVHGQADTLYAWEFSTAGNAQGWNPAHSLSPFLVSDGLLKTRIVSSDPYMFGPGGLSIDAGRYQFIEIGMRVERETNAEFFWTTSQQPDFVAGLEYGFTMIPDGEFHNYEVEVAKSSKWRGTVTRLRLDPGEGNDLSGGPNSVEIDYIRVVRLGPRPELGKLSIARRVVTVGDTTEARLLVTNAGDDPAGELQAKLTLPPQLQPAGDPLTQNLPTLAPGDTAEVGWRFLPTEVGEFTITAGIEGPGIAPKDTTAVVQAILPLPGFPPQVPATLRWEELPDGHLILENPRVRLACVKTDLGYGPLLLFRSSPAGQWISAAAIHPPAELAYRSSAAEGGHREVRLFPQSAVVVPDDDAGLRARLDGTDQDEDGVEWTYRLAFTLADDSSESFDVRYQVQPGAPRELLSFSGPMLRVGEGSTGTAKREAVLPGLEWLIDGEPSSSTLDVHPPKNERYLPHPYKVTIPTMWVDTGELAVRMTWDPLAAWYDTLRYTQPVFASPNTWDGEDNHLLGLVVPPATEWRRENERLAHEPVPLAAGEPVSVEARVHLTPSSGDLAGLKNWLAEQGLASLPATPRSYKEATRLGVSCFMNRLWEPSEKGWHMVLPDPWGPMRPPQVVDYLWLGSALLEDAEERDQLRGTLREVIRAMTAAGANPGAVSWSLALRAGGLDEMWSPRIQWAARHAEGQMEDGGWPYVGEPALKNAGDTSLGTCAIKAYVLLHTARITGNDFCRARGLKALTFMRQFRVPRGAQVWEVPLHAPDVLAAAHAVLAYVEGYRITGERSLLDEAVRWAHAGLPFIYLWSAVDRPAMAYGSIPVFGATWYTGAWFGRVVQWNGLDFANGLLHLAPHDSTLPWGHIAQGITDFALQIQRDEGTPYPENAGMYADAHSIMLGKEAYHWDLSPEKIMLDALPLSGLDPDVQTVLVPAASGTLHVNCGTPCAAAMADSVLSIEVDVPAVDTVYVAVARATKPESVILNGVELPERLDVDDHPNGWQYTAEGNIIIKRHLPAGNSRMTLAPISALSPQDEPRWEFNQGYLEGWAPNGQLGSVRVVGGLLTATSLGGDPWITGPFLDLDAGRFNRCDIRMRVDAGTAAQLFWIRHDALGYDESMSKPFAVAADGQFHEYRVPLDEHPEWRGRIAQLRFDPTNQANAEIAIDYIHFVETGTDVRRVKASSVPSTLVVSPGYPNPFRAQGAGGETGTALEFGLPSPGDVRIQVFDVLGRSVRTLLDNERAAGYHRVTWDGRDEAGLQVPSGVYFLRLSAEPMDEVTRKLLLLR